MFGFRSVKKVIVREFNRTMGNSSTQLIEPTSDFPYDTLSATKFLTNAFENSKSLRIEFLILGEIHSRHQHLDSHDEVEKGHFGITIEGSKCSGIENVLPASKRRPRHRPGDTS